MPKALITTVPFADKSTKPLELLNSNGIEYMINPYNRKLKEEELAELVTDYDVLIAGTEPITKRVLQSGRNLKLISRVGVGLDNVDLNEAKKLGIQVSYTPDAPAPAVAELTIGLMLSLLRSIHIANVQMHNFEWQRHFGKRISEVTIGIIGVGRIGSRVLKHLSGFGNPRVLVNDTHPIDLQKQDLNIQFLDKETIYRESDVITIHVPLSPLTKNMISREQLLQMKSDAFIINTARGGIVNEKDLADVLNDGHLSGAALDVFEQEPYQGVLSKNNRCLLTSHMGSMSIDCRTRMEIEATEDAVRLLTGQSLKGLVPDQEYANQLMNL